MRIRIFTAFAFIASLAMMYSCSSGGEYFLPEDKQAAVVTLDAVDISASSAILYGVYRMAGPSAADRYFEFSSSPDFPEETTEQYSARHSSPDSRYPEYDTEDGNWKFQKYGVYDLEPSTTYYYRLIIADGTVELIGGTKQFTTADRETSRLEFYGETTGTDKYRFQIDAYGGDVIGFDFRIINWDSSYGVPVIAVEWSVDWISNPGYVFFDTDEEHGIVSGQLQLGIIPNESGIERDCIVRLTLLDQDVEIHLVQEALEPHLIFPEGYEYQIEASGGEYYSFIPFRIENYGYECYMNNGDPGLRFESDSSWLSEVTYGYLEYNTYNCTGYINFVAEPNTAALERECYVTVRFRDDYHYINIVQSAGEPGT